MSNRTLSVSKGIKILLALGIIFSLSSCTVGPKYSRPATPVAPTYSEQPPENFKEAGDWKQAHPADAIIRADWWTIFNDPVLNRLEQQIDPANQTLKVADANFRQARAQITINRANLFPQISTSPSITNERLSVNRPYAAGGSSAAGNFTVPVDVSWEADLWGRLRRSVTAAREQFQATAADLENVRLTLHAELASDYFQARSLDRQKQLLDDTVVQYQKALQLTTNRYQGGLAAKAEVTQAQTQLSQAEAQDIDLGVARAQYEHAIAVLTGRPPETFKLEYQPMQGGPPAVPVGVPSQLLERRPDIAGAERRMAAANEQIGIAQAAFFPQLLLTAEGGLQGHNITDWFNWPSRFWAVGPQVSQYIFDAGLRRAQVQAAQASYDGTVSNYRQTALTAFQEVEDSLSTLRILEQEAAKQYEATAAAEASLQLTVNQYKGGLVNYLNVVTAQQIALANERSEVTIQGERMTTTVTLIMALGGGWNVSKLPQS